MNVVQTTEIKVFLTLNEAEATWLHLQMQNPLHAASPDDESLEDALMRNKFFHATILS